MSQKYSVLFLVIFLSINVFSQNLVPNPSFENMKRFPSCEVTLPKDTFNSYISDWFMPTNGTPDIFSKLVDPSCIASPNSTHPKIKDFPVANHEPRSGNNFAGLAINDYYREYLEVELLQPMVPGDIYCCEMYVSLSPSALFANDAIAMNFSENKLEGGNDIFFSEPQVTADSIITDTLNWVRVYATFKSSKAFKYLTIGSFRPIGGTSIIGMGPNSLEKYSGSYYYIDDISVTKINFTKPVIKGNLSVCAGDTIRLSADGWEHISWSHVGNSAWISMNNDLVTVSKPAITQYQVNGVICEWPVHEIVTINLNPEPTFDLGQDTLICEGTSLSLNPGSGLNNFQWQDGSNSSTYSASLEGQYKVTASNSFGCKGSDSILIGYYQEPQVELGDDIEQCNPGGRLEAYTGHNYDVYLWNDLSTKPYLDYSQEGTYWVITTNPCGVKKEDTIIIQKVELFLPNLVTDNNDKLNDKLVIVGAKENKGYLSVFNRNGTRVYENDKYNNSWPKEDLPEGIYYYEFKYPTCEVHKSWIHLIK